MTVRDNPVKRITVVQKIDGKLVIDIQGTVNVPIKLKLSPVSTQMTDAIFPACPVEMGSLYPSLL
jgi:hypothetical protein